MNSRPFSAVALGSVLILTLVLFLGISIAGSYALTIHFVDQSTAARERVQLQSAKGTCAAVRAMDEASEGVEFAKPSAIGIPADKSYGRKLSTAIHNLYVNSQCPQILDGSFKSPK